MTWGTFHSFLELAFAINVMFATWPRLGQMLEDWLVEQAKLEQKKQFSLKNESMAVSQRILSFEKRCGKSIPRWRFASGVIALVILGSLFFIPDDVPVSVCFQALLAFAVSPPIGAAVHLGVGTVRCARKNRRDMAPPPFDPQDVDKIVRRISGEDGPPTKPQSPV